MCTWEFITKTTITNKAKFCANSCPIGEFKVCALCDSSLENLKTDIDNKISKLKLIRLMIED